MKTAFIRRTGPPSVIEYGELPAPELHQGEVLVRLKAAAVDPVDAYIRQGRGSDGPALPLRHRP
jgi:NADPH2:quinone reductase